MGSHISRAIDGHRVRLGVIMVLLLLGLGITALPDAHATMYDLTGTGLGLPQRNYGTTLIASHELKLTSLVYGNRTGYPTGICGTVYLHETEGTGVQTGSWYWPGYTRINGYFTGAYESLVFNFSKAVDGESIKLFFNRIHHHYQSHGYVWIDIWVKPTSSPAFNISDVMSYFHATGGDEDPYHNDPNHETNGTLSGFFDFSEIPDLAGVGSIERIIVRAGKYSHFYVNGIDYQLYWDEDGDGYPADDDCDDDDCDVNPGAEEVCNDIDDDCDGNIDEGCIIYYRDVDEDGYGNTNISVTATSPPGNPRIDST